MTPPTPPTSNGQEQWQPLQPGLRKKKTPAGPWFQYRNVVGFEWNTYELMIHNLPAELRNFRILQIADLHCRNYWTSAYDDLIYNIQANPPHLILFTGDMVEDKLNPAPALPIIRRFLGSLRATLGIFAIHGNHDINIHQASLIGTGCKFIDEQHVTIHVKDAQLEIIGLPGKIRDDLTLEFLNSLPSKQSAVPRIVVAHYPDQIRKLEPHHPDIYMAGHTHGGQICLPTGIPIIRHDSLPQQLCRGIHRLAHSWFIVSRGFGFSEWPIRIFCPAEVIELRLVAG